MLTPDDDARLRDELCLILLEATSGVEALARVRREIRDRTPVYDVAPDPYLIRSGRIQPRDLLVTCAGPRCRQRFATSSPQALYCSERCRFQARGLRQLARDGAA